MKMKGSKQRYYYYSPTTHQQLHGSRNPHRYIVLGVGGPALRVVVLVDVEAAVSSARHEEVSVLRQVTNQPHRCLVSSLAHTGKPLLQANLHKHQLQDSHTYINTYIHT